MPDTRAFLYRLGQIVGPANVLTDSAALAPALTDWRGRYHGRALGMVLPATTAEVAAVVAACRDARVPMVPQGGNTGLVGGATPDDSGRAVIIGLRRLRRIREVDAGNNTLTAEAGCLLADVQAAAADADRLFPLSLASEGSCTIGGNLATNAGGVQVLRYGNARELCMGLEVVLPDGTVLEALRGLRKDNTGLDLKQLFIGAEGTLGLITAAVLKLFPRPTASATAWLALPDAAAAIDVLCEAQARFGSRVTACEMLSRPVLDLVFQHFSDLRDPLPGRLPWVLLLELSDGGNDSELRDALSEFIGEKLGGAVSDAAIAQSAAQARSFWRLRETAPEAEKREGISIKHDVSVPVSRVPEFLALAAASLPKAFPGARILAFGHVGDGNLHYNVCHEQAEENAAFIARQPEVNRHLYDIVHALGGSISAEHGIGQLKRDLLPRYKTPVELALMRQVKDGLDPLGLMNPGKLFSADPGH